MRTIRMEAVVLCLALGLVAVAWAEVKPSTTDRLDRLQKTYDVELAKIDKEADNKLVTLGKRYLKSLVKLEEGMQKAGKLEPLMAIKKERERFTADKLVAESNLLAAPAELGEVQKGFLAAAGSIELRRSRSTVGLVEKYDRTLDTLQARLTKEGALEDAMVVRARRDIVTQRAEVTAARFKVADAEARAKAEVAALPPEPDAVKPALAQPAATEMTLKTARKLIKKRYEHWCETLAEGDVTAAMEDIDPRFMAKVGTEALRPHLKAIVPHLENVKKANMSLDAGRIDVDLESLTAVSTPRIRIANQWKDLEDPVHWVCSDGDWYIEFRDKEKGEEGKKAGKE